MQMHVVVEYNLFQKLEVLKIVRSNSAMLNEILTLGCMLGVLAK